MISIFKLSLLLSVILQAVLCDHAANISEQIQAQQQKIRQSVGMTYVNYHLYPFAISTSKQEFVLSFHEPQIVKGEIMVHWIEPEHNQVNYPIYTEKQAISLKIVDMTAYKQISFHEFHFQSGLKLQTQPHHEYRLIFSNIGQKVKMIQFSLSYVEPKQIKSMTNTTNLIQEATSQSKQILEEVSNILGESQQSLITGGTLHHNIQQNLRKYLLGCTWEIVLIGSLVGTQYYILKKFLENQSII